MMRSRNLEKIFMNKKEQTVPDNILSDSMPSVQIQENRLKSVRNNNLEKKEKKSKTGNKNRNCE